MKLAEMQINDFLDVLKSDAPAPGGGSVSALSGAQGCALLMMVANLTIGKEKYAEYQQECEDANKKGQKLYDSFVAGIDKDTEAFNLVSAAYKMPKGTDKEKAERSKAIADGTLKATEVPFDTMRLGLEAVELVKSLVGRSNPNCSSDLGVALLQLKACVLGAWMNVKINLPGVKDDERAEYFATEGQRICDDVEKTVSNYFDKILTAL